jgi:uncharacterized protein
MSEHRILSSFRVNLTVPAVTEPMLSPCVGICTLDAEQICEGCGRSASEIALWTQFSAAQRHAIMARLDARA